MGVFVLILNFAHGLNQIYRLILPASYVDVRLASLNGFDLFKHTQMIEYQICILCTYSISPDIRGHR